MPGAKAGEKRKSAPQHAGGLEQDRAGTAAPIAFSAVALPRRHEEFKQDVVCWQGAAAGSQGPQVVVELAVQHHLPLFGHLVGSAQSLLQQMCTKYAVEETAGRDDWRADPPSQWPVRRLVCVDEGAARATFYVLMAEGVVYMAAGLRSRREPTDNEAAAAFLFLAKLRKMYDLAPNHTVNVEELEQEMLRLPDGHSVNAWKEAVESMLLSSEDFAPRGRGKSIMVASGPAIHRHIDKMVEKTEKLRSPDFKRPRRTLQARRTDTGSSLEQEEEGCGNLFRRLMCAGLLAMVCMPSNAEDTMALAGMTDSDQDEAEVDDFEARGRRSDNTGMRLSAKIVSAKTEGTAFFAFTRYYVRILRGAAGGRLTGTGEGTIVKRRYSDFVKLHEALKQKFGDAVSGLKLPPKKIVGNLDVTTVLHRQKKLNRFLVNLLETPDGVFSSREVQKFLGLGGDTPSPVIPGTPSSQEEADESATPDDVYACVSSVTATDTVGRHISPSYADLLSEWQHKNQATAPVNVVRPDGTEPAGDGKSSNGAPSAASSLAVAPQGRPSVSTSAPACVVWQAPIGPSWNDFDNGEEASRLACTPQEALERTKSMRNVVRQSHVAGSTDPLDFDVSPDPQQTSPDVEEHAKKPFPSEQSDDVVVISNWFSNNESPAVTKAAEGTASLLQEESCDQRKNSDTDVHRDGEVSDANPGSQRDGTFASLARKRSLKPYLYSIAKYVQEKYPWTPRQASVDEFGEFLDTPRSSVDVDFAEKETDKVDLAAPPSSSTSKARTSGDGVMHHSLSAQDLTRIRGAKNEIRDTEKANALTSSKSLTDFEQYARQATMCPDAEVGTGRRTSVEELVCRICCEKPREIIFQPCGHVLACANCAEKLIQRGTVTPAVGKVGPRKMLSGNGPLFRGIQAISRRPPRAWCPVCKASITSLMRTAAHAATTAD